MIPNETRRIELVLKVPRDPKEVVTPIPVRVVIPVHLDIPALPVRTTLSRAKEVRAKERVSVETLQIHSCPDIALKKHFLIIIAFLTL